MSFAGRHVLLGVSGGIACYKSCTLARRLTEGGATVDVVLTASAAEFVRPVTFEALTGRPVLTSLWQPDRALAHIALARQPDLAIVAPATAHLLARAALGLADDVLTALLLARTGPVLAAPAMNDAMYAHAATRTNVKTLAARGWHFIGPETGPLAEGPSERPGRMSEPEALLAAAARLLEQRAPWLGKQVVVTAGPTREHLDPVRVVTNPSSGRMGYAIAEAAHTRGAEVVLVSGPSDLPLPFGVTTHRVETTASRNTRTCWSWPRPPPTIAPSSPRPPSAHARAARSHSSSKRRPTSSPRSSGRRGAWWSGSPWRRRGRRGGTALRKPRRSCARSISTTSS